MRLDRLLHQRLAASDFSACPHFFAVGKPPVVAPRPTHRALCYGAFAILHSGESKTAVYVAQKLNRALVADADEKRTNKFFADARLRVAERATLEDYRGRGYGRGHLAPAGQMPTAQAMWPKASRSPIWCPRRPAQPGNLAGFGGRCDQKICRSSYW